MPLFFRKVFFWMVGAATSSSCSAAPIFSEKIESTVHASEGLQACVTLTGDFLFRGVRGGKQAGYVTFLGTMSRPAPAGVYWFRITIDPATNKVRATYFSKNDEIVLTLEIPGRCNNGSFVETRQYSGSHGGSSGPDTSEFVYTRVNGGDLVVSSKSRGTTYYVPGISSNYSSNAEARFSVHARKQEQTMNR